LLIAKEIADGTVESDYMMGLVTQSIDNGDTGKVTWFGKVRGIDTTGAPYDETWADGDLLWVSQSTAGYLTNVEPAGGQKILMAAVIHADAHSGSLFVRPTWNGVNRYIWENNASAGRLWGGIITDAGSGNIDIAAGAGLIKTGGVTIDCNLECVPTALNEGQGSETSLVSWDAIEDFPLAGVGYNLIFWDASEGEFVASLKENFYSVFNFVTDFTVGRVYYDGTKITIRLCGMNRWNFERRVQMFGEERFPVERASGLMLSETGTRNIAVTAGVVWAELVNRFSIDAFDSSASGTFSYWHRNGSGGWTETASQTQINNTQYDDGDGTLGTLTANRYGVHWVYVVHDNSVHVVYGQGDYTLAQAELTAQPATLPGIISAYATFAGRIIVQKSAATFTEVASPFTTPLGQSVVTDHNDLGGLQGGTAGEYHHLTAAQATAVANLATTYQPLDADLTAIAALSPTNDDIIQRKTGAWTNRTMAQLAADLTALQPATGWISYTAVTPTRTAADDPTYTIQFASVDLTAVLQEAMPVRWTQNSIIRYGWISSAPAFSGGNTSITILTRTDSSSADYDALDTGTYPITGFAYGLPKQPGAGMSVNPDHWDVIVTDTTAYTKTSPTQNAWYNAMDAGNLPSIVAPLGLWEPAFFALGRNTTNTSSFLRTEVALSTSTSSVSDAALVAATSISAGYDGSGNLALVVGYSNVPKILSVTSKTTYYLIIRSQSVSGSLQVQGSSSTTVLRLRNKYL
jgi:hypothetical protein